MDRIVAGIAFGLALTVCACAKAGVAAPASPPAAPAPAAAEPTEGTIRGELVDLACYLDHGARGESHKACGTTCALKGLPIGLLDKDNKITIIVGPNERPMNTELADKMGATIELTGKIVSRDGVQMIEVSSVH